MKKILLPMLLLMLLLVACTEEDTQTEETEERVTPVEVDEVTVDNLVIEKTFYGRTSPNATTPVMPPSAGEIDSLEVSNGDQVEEEEVIATFISAEGLGTIDIEAPADGQITSLDVKEGGMLTGSDPMAMIVDLDTIQIQVNITADNLQLFNDHDEATVTFSAIDLETTATIDYVSSVAGETGLYAVELSVDNEDTNIKPGMTAMVDLPENVVEDTLLIPTTALVEEGDESFVYVVKDDVAEKIAVTVVESQTNQTAIEGEISEGDTVVTNGQLTLTDGNQVDIMKEEN
ncbi:efflux RND transporter periplasmic adaptor subunit [Aquibacillus rhizosphaerae]|uniref:Efflux RND transporter periplasmic adaptor subunit n=1 Tax=Aquibacillus rhizosphaerae TaxID=3051431 RepID=A0ABT7L0M8_9BACI|nr:efflux RND transporter periplasmic adaptor subunit [Aquibacillus sp. LR5S19]MDL4838879.1 efflux RND transporter periplasmic adaptor subunit [Aquibacillus sp. LR5S19]